VLRTSELEYELPAGLIATHAAEPRDAAKMMVVHRSQPSLGSPEPAQHRDATLSAGDSESVLHRHVRDLADHLREGDLLVLNTTSVLPARLIGVRTDTGAKVQGLYVGPASSSDHAPDHPSKQPLWNVLLKMRRFKPGIRVALFNATGEPTPISLRLLARASNQHASDSGGWNVAVEGLSETNDCSTPSILALVGHTPLPPYILAARKHEAASVELAGNPSAQTADAVDRVRYQTVYADPAQSHSVAAPTAGLHFTPELLRRLDALGVRTANVVLHVGLGTFKPVETEYVEQHPMHEEWCMVPSETAQAIASARSLGGRVIAVGTTAARTLESFDSTAFCNSTARPQPVQPNLAHLTRLLVTPGYRFKHIDGMLTNFHLPRSTLLAMVAAMLGDENTGIRRLLQLYKTAITHGYRFYSYGDAMLILP